MASMIAVTIGIGSEHEALAIMAAERMRRATGLDVRILGAAELAASGLAHPCHLKFRLFELVDAENILYFDADAFCLRTWDPRALCDRAEWTTARGHWFDPWVRQMGTLYGFGDAIVAGGFFLINRQHHLAVLRLAESLQPRDNILHGQWNADEIALSSALCALRTPIGFLDRRYNWLRYGEENASNRAGAVIAHACDATLRQRYLREPPAEHDTPETPRAAVLPGDLADKTFIYDRVGHDLRPMELRADGTVGRGGGDAERYWFVTTRDGVRMLVISGAWEETCALVEDEHGIWRGRWNLCERMPVTLEKHRAQVVIDLVRRNAGYGEGLASWRSVVGGAAGPCGAEIGVFRGETSALLLAGLPNLRLYMVDPWRRVGEGTDYQLTGDECAVLSQADSDEAMASAAACTAFAADRRTIVPCDQARAAPFVRDQLDFAFIDGDHSYQGTLSAIETWWPKLNRGGLLAGHDYDHPRFAGVTRAVQEFARREHRSVSHGRDRTWWYEPRP